MYLQNYVRFKFQRNRPGRCRDLDGVPMHVHVPMKPPVTPNYVTMRLTAFDWLYLPFCNHPPNMSAIDLPKSRDAEVLGARAHVPWYTSLD